MSALTTYSPSVSAPADAPALQTLPLLREVPSLLEYRAEADPDAEFIPKTVAGFILGALCMFFCLDLAEAMILRSHVPFAEMVTSLVRNFAFMLGITGVAASLLLVGLKVRADHNDHPLFAKHWLNSIGTGTVYAVIIWGPWLLTNQGFHINRFVMAVIWMLLMTFPAIAAKWTIGPHRPVGAQ